MLKEYILKTFFHWKVLLKDRTFIFSFLAGLVVLFGGILVTYAVSIYKDGTFYEPVGDFILNLLPTVNLEFIFTYGIYAVALLTLFYSLVMKPERAPFILQSFGLLFLVRAAFVSLTQVGPPEGWLYADQVISVGQANPLAFRNDLFFSGHTAVPFMSFLLLKGTKFRWFMLASSFLMGVTVLLMHVHYSIDVFAAFFITYGIYAISNTLFIKLNKRFKRLVKLHGWETLKRRLMAIREGRRVKKDTVKSEGVSNSNLNLNS